MNIKANIKHIKKALKIRKQMKAHPKSFLILMTPTHQNVGDAAIAVAEYSFLKKEFPEYAIFEMTDVDLMVSEKVIKLYSYILKGFPVFIQGGGFMGDVWFDYSEKFLRRIMHYFKNQIIVFPQTVFYKKENEKEFVDSIPFYSRKRLTICAREKISFEKIYGIYSDVRLIPDMVLSYLPDGLLGLNRKQIGVCFRDDREKTMTKETCCEILRSLKSQDLISTFDLMYDERIEQDKRDTIVKEYLEKISGLRLVVTDRLHCMIFCAITKTPCIVIASQSYKIKGVYDECLSGLNYISFFDSYSQERFQNEVIRLLALKDFSTLDLQAKYLELKALIEDKFNISESD